MTPSNPDEVKAADFTCCLCSQEIPGHGNNSWPLCDDVMSRCCDACNTTRVIPERIRRLRERS